MGQIDRAFCIKCGGITNQEWQIDRDSDPDEPQFFTLCLRCEKMDDFFEKELPKGQEVLF